MQPARLVAHRVTMMPPSLARCAHLGALLALGAGCGDPDTTGTVVLKVDGLLAGDSITVFASDKAGPLDNDFTEVSFEQVGNGVHRKHAKASTFKMTCPSHGTPQSDAYVVEPGMLLEQQQTLSAGGEVTFSCSYQTGTKLTDISIDDLKLRDCVLGTGKSYAHRLEQLACDSHGISSLAGIEQLTSTVDISLAGNAITDVAPLGALTQLFFLKLMSNQIQHGVSALVSLTHASQLWLDNNPSIPCTALQTLIDTHGDQVVRPPSVEPGVNCTP